MSQIALPSWIRLWLEDEINIRRTTNVHCDFYNGLMQDSDYKRLLGSRQVWGDTTAKYNGMCYRGSVPQTASDQRRICRHLTWCEIALCLERSSRNYNSTKRNYRVTQEKRFLRNDDIQREKAEVDARLRSAWCLLVWTTENYSSLAKGEEKSVGKSLKGSAVSPHFFPKNADQRWNCPMIEFKQTETNFHRKSWFSREKVWNRNWRLYLERNAVGASPKMLSFLWPSRSLCQPQRLANWSVLFTLNKTLRRQICGTNGLKKGM